MAHEVRNPLAGIRSTVQLWQRLPEQARTPESLDAVLGSGGPPQRPRQPAALLRPHRLGRAAPVDLNAVVRETLELVRAQAAAQGVRLEADLQTDLPTVAGSHQALQQVVMNLAANALQAMPKGGRLDVRTRAPDDGRWVELVVADTGPGVPPEVRPQLFEPFYTTRPDGTGLGLALCREIVRQHRGEIDLDDGRAGRRLPRPASRGSCRGENAMTRVPHRATILVADDDAIIRANLALLLRSEGYAVREAADGQEAARALQDPAVALALLDLRMPGQDGMEVLRAHADRLDETPVIVVTAYGGRFRGHRGDEARRLRLHHEAIRSR